MATFLPTQQLCPLFTSAAAINLAPLRPSLLFHLPWECHSGLALLTSPLRQKTPFSLPSPENRHSEIPFLPFARDQMKAPFVTPLAESEGASGSREISQPLEKMAAARGASERGQFPLWGKMRVSGKEEGKFRMGSVRAKQTLFHK